LIAQNYKSFFTIKVDNNVQRKMRLYTENEKEKLQFYYQLLASNRNNIALYKSVLYVL